MPSEMKLGLFLRPTGHHVAGWRDPGANTDGSFEHFAEMARIAEEACFDLLFCADIATLWEGSNESLCRLGTIARIDPYTLLSGLGARTSKIGLVCTGSTTYDEPFHVARRFASLDLATNGRAGWNLVTSMHEAEAKNFGRAQHLHKTERYRRAREFARVVRGLWDSWEPDAFVRDKQSALFFDPDKLHVLNHQGDYFRVQGPLNVPPSPQGHPIMVQAGASDEGRELAAETADIIFSATTAIEDAKAFYADVKSRMAKYGREPFELKIMPGFNAIVAETMDEAQAKHERLQDLIPPAVGLRMLSHYMGYDLTSYPEDGPLPELEEKAAGKTTRADLLAGLARRENLNLRQLYKRVAGARGHFQIVGTPRSIADTMQEWFENGAADGFNVMPSTFPGGLTDFVALVIPELRRRGLFRRAYQGSTLRQHLGLGPARRTDWQNPGRSLEAAGVNRAAS
jgi:FMN-dependent oxidoreductase (nitrilotriacetate monooxygenase family)